MYKLLILLSFTLTACNTNTLGSQISKGLIERRAMDDGEFCYTNKFHQRFCVKHMGTDRVSQTQAEAEQSFGETIQIWWNDLDFF